eukprot:CAMPEP_0196655940 /NCGR_PEP_ID=MMETSP1086-20130531/11681_1 /TAXON_ID=77921 /ORGANISM="Cyanoptyche  gloeocystis , Strain SAG4.97" /LENGTH=31 /DNA_ID= /DNA_START= /DNA_END= /DNA_ORIENTATION=
MDLAHVMRLDPGCFTDTDGELVVTLPPLFSL